MRMVTAVISQKAHVAKANSGFLALSAPDILLLRSDWMTFRHLIIPHLPSNYSKVRTTEGTKTDLRQAIPIKLQHNNCNDNDEDVNDDDDNDDDEDDDNYTDTFVSALRVLSSFRECTSFCLVFLGVFKNTFGNDYSTI